MLTFSKKTFIIAGFVGLALVLVVSLFSIGLLRKSTIQAKELVPQPATTTQGVMPNADAVYAANHVSSTVATSSPACVNCYAESDGGKLLTVPAGGTFTVSLPSDIYKRSSLTTNQEDALKISSGVAASGAWKWTVTALKPSHAYLFASSTPGMPGFTLKVVVLTAPAGSTP
jgi:hypothetical protein